MPLKTLSPQPQTNIFRSLRPPRVTWPHNQILDTFFILTLKDKIHPKTLGAWATCSCNFHILENESDTDESCWDIVKAATVCFGVCSLQSSCDAVIETGGLIYDATSRTEWAEFSLIILILGSREVCGQRGTTAHSDLSPFLKNLTIVYAIQ